MTVRTRLLILLASVAAVLTVPMLYGVVRLATLRDIALSLRTSHATAYRGLGNLEAHFASFDRYARTYLINGDSAQAHGMRQALQGARKGWRFFSPGGYDDLAEKTNTWLDSLEASARRIQELGQAGDLESARAVYEDVWPLLARAQDSLTPMASDIDRASATEVARARVISTRAARTALVATVVALLAAVGVALWMTLSLTRPIEQLRDSMAVVAGGHFVAPSDLPYERGDEIGDLTRSFRAMSEQLAELERVKTEFVHMISHDLKAPLNMINGCAELIEDETTLTGEQRELVDTIREHVRLLTDRVNKLLILSRLEAHAFPVHAEEVPSSYVFQNLRNSYDATARQHQIDFDVQLEASTPALVFVDTECLSQEILGNLMSNALKFTPSGGRIAIRVWGTNGDGDRPPEMHFTVSDTGPGIPESELPYVFDKYYQVGGRRRTDGTGLGLAIVRGAVEAHGGHIEASSGPNGGTTFHVVLPVAGPVSRLGGPAPSSPSHSAV